jgi:AcrR family transcriptional regulator
MTSRDQDSLAARKTPVQTRSQATVQAISEATIQVLLRDRVEHLTTTRVAQRAGVSVGTLYQYYRNKEALLHTVLKGHLEHVTDIVEGACKANHHKPLRTMVEALVQSFVSAKLEDREASVALYAVASESDGEALVARLSKRALAAITAMLRTAPGVRFSQPEFTAFMLLSSIVGATRAVLEAGASHKIVEDLRRHLVLLGESYLHKAGTCRKFRE